MDYEKLSTEELLALQNGQYDKLSNETLQALRQAEIERSATTLDEMHPELSFADRAIVKNFSSNPESSMAYLKKQYPDMVFRNVGGEIQARNKNETEYRVLDPSGLDLQDATDIVTDVGQGFVDGASKLLGATAGGLVGGPIGAVAGGAGLSAASGAGTEYLKQGAGSMLGIPDNINNTNAAISAGANVIMPAAGNLISKGYNTTKNTIAPNIVSYLSGIPKDVIKNINIDDEARNFIKKTGASTWLDNVFDKSADSVKDQEKRVGEKFRRVLPEMVNIDSGRKAALNRHIEITGNGEDFIDPEAVKILNMLSPGKKSTSATDGIMMNSNQGIPVSNALDIKKRLYHDYLSRDSQGSLPATYLETGMAQGGYGGIRESLKNQSKDPVEFEAVNKEFSDMLRAVNSNSRLRSLKDGRETLDKSLKMDQLLNSSYENGGLFSMPKARVDDEAFKYIKNIGGPDLELSARQKLSADIFNDPKVMPKNFIQGMKAGTLGSAAGAGIGYGLSGGLALGLPLTIAGGIAGEIAASPWAIKKAATSTKGVENLVNRGVNASNNLSPYILRSAPKSFYNMMDGREN